MSDHVNPFHEESMRELAEQDRREKLLIEEFNEQAEMRLNGVEFDPAGPSLERCEGCDTLTQYSMDHECSYTRSLNAEAAAFEDATYGRDE